MKAKAPFCILAAMMLAPNVFAQARKDDPHLAKAVELRDQARSAYASGEYDSAAELARRAKAELALVAGGSGYVAAAAPGEVLPLPAEYTVRYIPGDRDSLSKIAGYPFVYGNRARWTMLYQANKTTLKHPEDADIILPGEVLVIPSISGETRSGAWADGSEYPAYRAAR
jgi:nucleoid-associated protein YgaU